MTDKTDNILAKVFVQLSKSLDLGLTSMATDVYNQASRQTDSEHLLKSGSLLGAQ